VQRVKKHLEQEERQRRYELFLNGKILWHAWTRNKPIPPTSKKEAEGGGDPDWDGARKYKDYRDEHDEMVDMAFGHGGHPFYFEDFAMYGYHFFDKPPEPERPMSPEEVREIELRKIKQMWQGPPPELPEDLT
jgi:hypothetical protein